MVAVDSLGFRDPERPAGKPPGVIRILCLGGSNAYGAAVEDSETYPAQLERVLNKGSGKHYEVWNAGVSAYVLSQDVDAAQDAAAVLDPDVLLFMRTNKGRRAFLRDQEIEPYFSADPRRFNENLLYVPLRDAAGAALMAHWRLYRAAVIAFNRVLYPSDEAGRRAWEAALVPKVEPWLNIAPLRSLWEDQHGRRLIFMLSNPNSGIDDEAKTLPIPWIDLQGALPRGAGPEYGLIHPSAHVYSWYADVIAKRLRPFLKRRRVHGESGHA